MGHRAIYAIRSQGNVDLFYSHWGALTVPQDLFWGPSWAEAFIRSLEPAAEWLDDVWAEGAAALDKDQRRVTFYGGELSAMDVFAQLMQAAWGDAWTVRYDAELVNVAATIGVPESAVAAEHVPHVIPLDCIGENLANDHPLATLVRAKRNDAWIEGVVDFSIVDLMNNGADAFLARVDTLPTLAALRKVWLAPGTGSWKTLGDALCAVVLDPTAKVMRLCLPSREHASTADLRVSWPGWEINLDDDLATCLASSGRALDADMARTLWPKPQPKTLDEQLADIERALFGAVERKASVASFVKRSAALTTRIAPSICDGVNPRRKRNGRSGDCARSARHGPDGGARGRAPARDLSGRGGYLPE